MVKLSCPAHARLRESPRRRQGSQRSAWRVEMFANHTIPGVGRMRLRGGRHKIYRKRRSHHRSTGTRSRCFHILPSLEGYSHCQPCSFQSSPDLRRLISQSLVESRAGGRRRLMLPLRSIAWVDGNRSAATGIGLPSSLFITRSLTASFVVISDSQQNRTLDVAAHWGEDVDDDNCQYQCTQLGYNYAGTEYSGTYL